MRVKTHEVLARAVEEGIAYGYTRAHKHTDTPAEDYLKTELYQAVMNSICEMFDFDEERKEDA